MKPFDLSLYLVTDRRLNKRLNIFQIVEEAIAGGVTIVQLREKDANAHTIKEMGTDLLKILKPKSIPLLINDFPEVTREIGADGVHLGSSDMNPRRAREILGGEAIIGLSIESLEHFRKADLTAVDYLAASPVFPTLTKMDLGPPFYLEELRKLCSESHLPVVAIGQIHIGNVQNVLETKVDGIAVVSAICSSDTPRAAAQELKSEIRSLQAKPYRVLTIAGSDSGGGAGIQADLKTFQALRCYGMSVITALTAQNTVEVKSVFPVTPRFVQEQLTAVLEDIGVDAVKIGMLFSKEIIEVVRNTLVTFGVKNIVLDPVMVAKSGDKLLLSKGTLAKETFSYYNAQDALYLKEFAKALAILATKIEDPKTIKKILQLARDCLKEAYPSATTGEMNLANIGYTSFLLATAAYKTREELAAALLPCFWIYLKVADDLKDKVKETNPNAVWFKTYYSDVYREDVQSMIEISDDLAKNADEKTLGRMLRAFEVATRWELSFWDASYYWDFGLGLGINGN